MAHFLTIVSLAVAGCSGGLLAQATTGDASRGEQLVRDRGCIICHKVNGEGGNGAPDLGARRSRNYTPAGLAVVMWNHAPSAWAKAGTQSKGTLAIGAGQADDLFAYFSSRRYFEPLGDARRGKQVFSAKQCSSCHGIRERVSADAPPVVAWRSLRDPIGFAQDMWNRQAGMGPAFERQRVHHQRLTSSEMNDLLTYLDNLLGIRGKEPQFHLADSETGRIQFQSMQCDSCHRGKLSLEKRADRISMADIQAAMWNHALTRLKARPAVSYDEMSSLVGYLWSLEPGGDPRHGERAFARRKCADCHADLGKGALTLSARDLSPVFLITALWSHGPAMQAEMNRKSLAWPRIGRSDIADMAAYLRTRHPAVLKEAAYGAAGIDSLARIQGH
jgi:mono/diheme cytochrome c family protein